MKFVYEYRTSDNVRHEGVIVASDREAVFTTLREKGIRPGRVTEAPGFFNKLLGKGKRWIAIAFLLAVAVIASGIALTAKQELKVVASPFEDKSRHQVIGDAYEIEKAVKSGWEDVFSNEGERFFAGFAIPGSVVAVRTTTEDEVKAALERKVSIEPNDSIEVRQIKSMVEGLKDELRTYLQDGGTIAGYCRRLVKRQEAEIVYYQQIKQRLDDAIKRKIPRVELEEIFERDNRALRRKGLKTIPLPE